MKNTFGSSVTVTIFGESHGEAVGVVLDGLAPGLPINHDFIKSQLDKRRPQGKISTSRQETDEYQIISGAFNGYTTGTPLTIVIPNTSTKSKDYEATKMLMRPSHADRTAWSKYHGYQDYRGGGHFSGRITAGLVAAGAIAIDTLRRKDILLGTHIAQMGSVTDRPFGDYKSDFDKLGSRYYGVLDDDKLQLMLTLAEQAAADGDSVGGILETAVIGVPAGLGEPWFDTAEGLLSHALFSVPAVKGVEFGLGFGFCNEHGSTANDEMYTDGTNILTKTNHNGGINGGITNGMPITFRTVIKPTPSIYKEQNTVDIAAMQNAKLTITGRHDPAIVHRARVVVDSVTSLVLLDLLACRYGTDFIKE